MVFNTDLSGRSYSTPSAADRRVAAQMVAKPVSLEFMDAQRRVAQDKAYSVALGGGLRQIGIETPRAEGSNFLRPDQIANIIALRGGADPGAVLGGASAPASGVALSELFSTPFGQWPTVYKLGAAVAVLGTLALLSGVLRR